MNKMKLYRGFSRHGKDYRSNWFNEKSVKSRNPQDTAINVHVVADEWFETKFGIKARSEAVFFSTSFEQAKRHTGNGGEVLELYEPLDRRVDYKFIFSEKVTDFIEINADINDVNSKEEVITWLEAADYKCVGSRNEIPADFEGEVMLACEGYYLKKLNRK